MTESHPFGTWTSPVTGQWLTAGTITFEEILVSGDHVYWVEMRPDEARSVVVRWDGRRAEDVTPAPFNVGSKVHEYGGNAIAVDGQILYFVDRRDQRVYRLDPQGEPGAITPHAPLRFADLEPDPLRGRLFAVCEDHSESDLHPDNFIVTVPQNGGPPQRFVSGNDFYATPRLSPDGTTVAWITWSHPNMPWDGTELWMGNLDAEGALADAQLVAGGPGESVCHPRWSPEGVLYFVSDRTGWWNLYRAAASGIEAVTAEEAEFGRPTTRGWSYDFLSDGDLVTVRSRGGRSQLVLAASHGESGLTARCSAVADPRVLPDGSVAYLGGSASQPLSVWISRRGRKAQLLHGTRVTLPDGFLAEPEVLEFPTSDGGTAHAFHYPPRNPSVSPPSGQPPLVVFAHGGPVGASATALNLGTSNVAFWTSRGYAVLDVNYRGSTGYGRTYREQLYGRWGIADVDDCIDGAMHLVRRGDADPQRMVIRGGSAGGYTVLCALAFRDVFAAGTAYFGISDLEVFHGETHKFEAHYDQQLIGDWDTQRDRYRQRSPIHAVGDIHAPVLLLQGLEDRVVPPNQSRLIVEELKRLGRPVAYIEFEGEGHGFRRAETISRCLGAEEAFYSRVLDLPRPDLQPLDIANQPAPTTH
ncbi:MAG TPA: S9 family peptidase [Actinomycetota bacterium]|nr:S9 family peptidase [Actinomycetota bacterium]